MKSKTYATGAFALLSLGAYSGPFAHGGATGVVAERMNGMMMLQEQVKLLNPMFNGSAAIDPMAVSMAAKMIVDHGGEKMIAAFPEGSIEGPSEAKPAIWAQWDEFRRQALELSALGSELSVSISAPFAVPVVAAELPDEPERPPLTEWEQMDLDVLLGLKTRAELEEERAPSRPAMNEEDIGVPAVREARVVFADIVSSCSSCHSQFRN